MPDDTQHRLSLKQTNINILKEVTELRRMVFEIEAEINKDKDVCENKETNKIKDAIVDTMDKMNDSVNNLEVFTQYHMDLLDLYKKLLMYNYSIKKEMDEDDEISDDNDE